MYEALEAKSPTALLISGVFGLITTLIPLVDGWLQRKSHGQRLEAELNLASKEIAFWKSWLEAQTQAVDPGNNEPKRVVIENLNNIATRQQSRSSIPSHNDIPHKSRPFLPRLLLLYAPRYVAWLPRSLYYAMCLEFAYGIANLQRGSLTDPWVIFGIVLVFALILILRATTIQVEENRRLRETQTR